MGMIKLGEGKLVRTEELQKLEGIRLHRRYRRHRSPYAIGTVVGRFDRRGSLILVAHGPDRLAVYLRTELASA
jgi:hypothetical protein